VIFMNKDKADSTGYVFATNEIGDTLSLLENDFTLGSLVSIVLHPAIAQVLSVFWRGVSKLFCMSVLSQNLSIAA